MALIGDIFSTGDGLTLGVSLVLLEIPNEPWVKASIINALNTMTIERNWAGDNGDITPEQAQQIASLMLQTLLFDYEPPVEIMPDIGDIKMHGGEFPPSGWFRCTGAEVSRDTYGALFSVIGESFGDGDGSTTFNLPNFIDRSPIGYEGDVAPVMGGTDGTLSVTLTTAQIPSHTHAISDPGHAHRIPKMSATVNAGVNTSTPAARTDNPATPTMTTDVAFTGASITATGGGGSHSNLHPVLGVLFCIYAGV